MYGFIHCCLEDMVLQLFGEPAWREILNVAGIKLRGASFLMHQVYDDETTFKLVVAASQVSGLPVEVCLEEFGKHFLVYCQKNGYDQILRVLGSNLYDFLTNLDNLHDHLASIYPGMRAPSFRVTRSLGGSGGGGGTGTGDSEHEAEKDVAAATAAATALQADAAASTNSFQNNDNESKVSLAAGSMYLHYYSERKGLSPIVKGLVLAVAREFFSTDIVVTECKLLKPQLNHADDHVVLKIDRRSQADILLDEQTSQAVAAAAAAAAQQVATPSPSVTPTPTPEPPSHRPPDDARANRQQLELKQKTMLSLVGDRLSKLASDSLINSEIMMQTFPFHVIFDRHFNLVQVGSSLLRVTSLYWQRRKRQQEREVDKKIKFGDLFSIVRPKIEFTFDAIADHTNQVFVVKTRPLVLNADYLRSIAVVAASGDSDGVGCPVPRPAAHPPRRVPVPDAASMCPMNRLAMKRRSCAPRLANDAPPTAEVDHAPTKQPENPDAIKQGHHNQAAAAADSDAATNVPSLRLKGQMIILSEPTGTPEARAADPSQPGGEPYCLYLCSPRVDHLDQLLECGVRMSDLALHDRARELMLMSHTHKEDRETVKKLDQATNDLKKMDTKLRQENKRTNEVLHNIFPAKIATLLSHGAQIESESFDPVTCLYSDIIGFTKMCGSENVRPIDIVRLLNTLYLQFDNLTNIHGVYKVETIGDAYVIVGGLPEPAEDHADRCVRMGLDMVKVIATVRSPADNQPIQMRIGIHSGPVMAGIVGIRVPRYSLFGNTTTLANQLETHGQGGKIHISEFTLKKLIKRDRFVIEDNPNQISGFPFKTHFVTDYLSDRGELLEHEKILEEQLIRDFELMGNEVELVDDSQRQQQARTPRSTATAAATRGLVANEPAARAGGQQKQQRAANHATPRDQEQRPIVLMDVEEARLRKMAPEATGQLMEQKQATPRSSEENAQDQQVAAGRKRATVQQLPANYAAKPMDQRQQQEAAVPQKRRQLVEQKRKMPSGELVDMSIRLSDEILSEAVAQYGELRTLERLLALLDAHRRAAKLGGSSISPTTSVVPNKRPPHAASNILGLFEAASCKQAEQVAEATGSGSCPLCSGAGQMPEWRADELQAIRLISAAVSVALASIGNMGSIKFPAQDGAGDEGGKRFNRFLDHLIGARSLLQVQPKQTAACDKPGSASRAPEAADRQTNATTTTTTTTGTLVAQSGAEATGSSSLPSSGGDLAHKTMRPNEPPPSKTATPQEPGQNLSDGLGQLLANLRQERERLSCQVGRLELRLSELELELEESHAGRGEQCANAAPSGGGGGSDDARESRCGPSTESGPRHTVAGAARPVLKSSSSNIQRMKRMDTLKRRKIKREQQQQTGAASLPASPASSSLNSSEFGRVSGAPSPGAQSPVRPPRPSPGCVARAGSGLTLRAPNEAPAIPESDAEQDECEAGAERPAAPSEARPQGPAQIYQTVRSSLASLLSDSNTNQRDQQEQQQQQQKRKRFSLSAFGTSFSAALGSPFSSPKKVPLAGGGSQPPPVSSQQAAATQRHHGDSASRSQSISSSQAAPAGARAATAASRLGASQQAGNNCNCLRSSGSSQSIESTDMR